MSLRNELLSGDVNMVIYHRNRWWEPRLLNRSYNPSNYVAIVSYISGSSSTTIDGHNIKLHHTYKFRETCKAGEAIEWRGVTIAAKLGNVVHLALSLFDLWDERPDLAKEIVELLRDKSRCEQWTTDDLTDGQRDNLVAYLQKVHERLGDSRTQIRQAKNDIKYHEDSIVRYARQAERSQARIAKLSDPDWVKQLGEMLEESGASALYFGYSTVYPNNFCDDVSKVLEIEERDLVNYENHIATSRRHVETLKAKIEFLKTKSGRNFEEMADELILEIQNLMPHTYTSFEFHSDKLVATTAPIIITYGDVTDDEPKDYLFGPLVFTFDEQLILNTSYAPGAQLSDSGRPHPHLGHNNCLGNMRSSYTMLKEMKDISALLSLMYVVASHYNPSDAYVYMNQFQPMN